MSQYLDWFNVEGGGEDQPTSTEKQKSPKPSSLERGRSDTVRSNVNADQTSSINVVDDENEKSDDRGDSSMESLMCIPFLPEERDAGPDGLGEEQLAIPKGEEHKVRKRDVAPSPPRSRVQTQLENEIAEAIAPSLVQNASASNEGSGEEEEPVEQASNSAASDDRSLSSLYDMIADAFSIVDSTASTEKASGGRRKDAQGEGGRKAVGGDESSLDNEVEEHFGFLIGSEVVPMARVGSESTISTNSALSHMEEEDFLALDGLDTVPENDVLDTVIVPKKKHDLLPKLPLSPSRRFTQSSLRKARKSPKGKSSKVLKDNLKSLSVLVYGKRLSRRNFEA